jgi:hypothetical protein
MARLGPAGAGCFLLGLACVPADGGAVEASWVIRSEGRAVSECGCADPAIAKVRFRIVGVEPEAIAGADWCAGRTSCDFSCARQTGVTPFAIPAGLYAISVTALGVEGEDLTEAPPAGPAPRNVARVPTAPILRKVVEGQPTQLDAFVIEAGCAPVCSGGEDGKVCTKG